eukprot:64808_1
MYCWQFYYIYTVLWVCYSFNTESRCNHHGLVFRDSNYTICECFDCFYGKDCEFERETCVVDAVSGNPLMYNEYWRQKDDSKPLLSAEDDKKVPSLFKTINTLTATQ